MTPNPSANQRSGTVYIQETVLLNATVGVQRVLGRLRRPSDPRPATAGVLRARSRAAAGQLRHGVHSVAAASRLVPTRERTIVVDRPVATNRRSILGRLGTDRSVAVAVAGILLGASLVSITAGHPAAATGGTNGSGQGPRIAVGGGTGAQGDDSQNGATDGPGDTSGTRVGGRTGTVQLGAPDPTLTIGLGFEAIDLGDGVAPDSEPIDVEGPFTEDGTLVKPIAVDTTVPDGRDLVQTYTVKPGDTLAGIAAEYRVSMMSVWWANNLKSKTDLHKGQQLRIPPVTGLIITVAATDTLDELAAKYDVNSTDILATNGIDDPNLVVGQVLVVPGAKGKAMPVPKPASNTATRPSTRTGLGGSVRPPVRYSGGAFIWPVIGGGNYISQYFHYGHYAIDIAADYGSTVRAAAAGTVIFAGWKNNGGGYQVWIAHGSNLYTTYNHMSAISVGRGQHVGRGSHVGRVGQSGNATGPHLHFEVWRGPVWDGGTRVNPLGYF